jgi:hypothetical protein
MTLISVFADIEESAGSRPLTPSISSFVWDMPRNRDGKVNSEIYEQQ